MTDAHGGTPLRSLASAWHVALRNLFHDRLRFVLSIVSVALALMLILFLLGLRSGLKRSAVVYLDNAPGSVAVLPPGGQTTSAGSAQFLSPEVAEAVASTEGVAKVTPILLTLGFSEFHGTKEVIKLVGYEAPLGGGPWDLRAGREPASDDEAVLDSVLARRHDIEIGDSVEVVGRPLTVVGLSNQTASLSGSYVFARKTTVESVILAPGGASVLLVTPATGTTPTELVARLQALPGANVLLKRELMDNDIEVIAGIADPILLLMVAAAIIVGALVVGMVIYTATNERRAEYGILKAIGAGNGVLYQVVAWQALASGSLGAVFGIGFALAMRSFVLSVRPQFMIVIGPWAIVATVAAGLFMALAGGLLPARSAGRLAPAEVFRR